MKILIIEDEASIAEMYRVQFTTAGHDVIVVNNGAEGIAAIIKETPHIALLDLIMPIVNGYEVLDKLKKSNILNKVKVYILSNLGQDNEVEKGLALGADAYFVKSQYTPTELLRKVEALASTN